MPPKKKGGKKASAKPVEKENGTNGTANLLDGMLLFVLKR